MSKQKSGMIEKRLYRKVCSLKYTSEKKAPATVRILQRKLKTLRRRYHSLEAELKNLRDKNAELAKSVQIEKYEQSRLRDEHYKLNSQYHNLSLNYNSTKEELIRSQQLISTLEDDTTVSFAWLLKVSESIALTKSRIREYFSFSQSKLQKDKEDSDVSVRNSLSPQIRDAQNLKGDQSGTEIIEQDQNTNYKYSGVPVRQRVGPMIKGYPITKPKIMLKRISIPLQQEELGDIEEEEDDNSDTANDSSAIPPLMPTNEEEGENKVSSPKLSTMQRHRSVLGFRLHSKRSGDLKETDNDDTSNDATAIPPLVPINEDEEENVVSRHFQVNGPKLLASKRRSGFRYRLHTVTNGDSSGNNDNEESASVSFTCETTGENTNNCAATESVDGFQNVNRRIIDEENTAVFEVNGPNSLCTIGNDKTEEGKECNKEERRKCSVRESKTEVKGDINQNRILKRPCEDPLEGCSWMYTSRRQKSRNAKRRNQGKKKLYFEGRPMYSSDDSLSDDENVYEPSNNNNISLHTPQVSKENNTMNIATSNEEEEKVVERVPQESFSCSFFDHTKPNHNSDRKLCNVCKTCVELAAINTRPRPQVSKNIDECADSAEPENTDFVTYGFSKESNSWSYDSSNKTPDWLTASPCKANSLISESNGSLCVSNDVHTSTPESYENPPLKVELPNVLLQRLDLKLTSCESACVNNNKQFSNAQNFIKGNETVDVNENVEINKTSSEFHQSVDCAQSDTSDNTVRRSERISLRSTHCSMTRKKSIIVPSPNRIQHHSKRSESWSIHNESSDKLSMTNGGRPRRNVNKVSYKPVSLRKKLRRE